MGYIHGESKWRDKKNAGINLYTSFGVFYLTTCNLGGRGRVQLVKQENERETIRESERQEEQVEERKKKKDRKIIKGGKEEERIPDDDEL